MTKNAVHTPVEHNSEEHNIRVQKVHDLEKLGIAAWPAGKQVNATCKQVLDEFTDEESAKVYRIAGRVMTSRLHGKTAFAHLQDRSGKVQIYVRQDVIGDEAFNLFDKYVDLGDIIWCEGTPFRTKTGEVTLKVTQVALLSKCLHPLPEKFHGLTDVEVMYRQRYLDLMTNEESRQRFAKRSKMLSAMRRYFEAHGFMEVETPMLHPIPGGAAARPFVTHHNALDSDFYLRIAPELYLKRLVVGGFERVYEINRNFRNEGISTRHNPEFTMVELYMAHEDYHFMMGFIEQMIRTVTQECNGTTVVPFGQYTLDFGKPFARLRMLEAVAQYGNIAQDTLKKDIDAVLKEKGVSPANKQASWGEKLYALFEALVESQLIQPTFIIDFPIEVSPLAKRDAQNPDIAARFELFIAGMEVSNGFNELNDPFDQAARFRQQAQAREGGDVEAHHYDADYILALEHALPPTVGVGVGIDRLAMLVTNAASIKDVILFPTLKKRDYIERS